MTRIARQHGRKSERWLNGLDGTRGLAIVLAGMVVLGNAPRAYAQASEHQLTCSPEHTIGRALRTLKPGDTITVTGNPAQNGAHTLWIRKLIGPDGESLQLFED